MCALGSRHLVPARIFGRNGWIAPTIASVGVSLLFFGLILGFVGGSPPPDEWDLQVPGRPVTLFSSEIWFPAVASLASGLFSGSRSCRVFSYSGRSWSVG